MEQKYRVTFTIPMGMIPVVTGALDKSITDLHIEPVNCSPRAAPAPKVSVSHSRISHTKSVAEWESVKTIAQALESGPKTRAELVPVMMAVGFKATTTSATISRMVQANLAVRHPDGRIEKVK
jgi:hypothetical protein